MKLFIILWIGQLISQLGSGLTSFGLAVHVFRTTGSAFLVSMVALASFLPYLVLSVPAGVLSDKYDRRLLMVIGDGCSAIGVGLILLSIALDLPFVFIIIGSAVSSAFSSLTDPAFRATISDVLTEEEYAKAGGLNGLSSGVRFIICPLLSALLLSFSGMELLLTIDILSFVPTIIAALSVRKRTQRKESDVKISLLSGFRALSSNRGLIVLVVYTSLLTFFMGVIQILSEPMILSFSSVMMLSVSEVVCASGMIVSSLIISKRGIRMGYRKTLSLSLVLSGLAMAGFGACMNLFVIVPFGFAFFLTIPYANTALDYLVRSNLKRDEEGSAWGAVGFVSQLGYVFSYSLSGFLSEVAAGVLGVSVGRGCALVISAGGLMLSILALFLLSFRSIRKLER
ncbi:MAG: MFS transporter [Bullifex sp.]